LYWSHLDALIQTSELVIDRPKGSPHPRFNFMIYPLDYGYLKGTSGSDGLEVDVWLGSRPDRSCDAILCTADTLKKDVEVKLLLGCTEEEKTTILDFHNFSSYMSAIMVRRAE
jgi:inorganic pyrophosphatase